MHKPNSLRIVMLVLLVSATALAQAQKSADVQMERAVAAMQAGKNDEAIAALNEAIKLQPDNAAAYFLRCSLKVAAGDTAGALADISKVIELKPDMGAAYYERAILRLVSKDNVSALKDLDLAIANNYKNDPAYSLRYQLRAEQGDLKGALADLDEAIKLNPNNPRSYLSRADLLLRFEDRERAFADLNYLLTWYETNPTKRASPPKAVSQADKPANGQVGKENKEGDSKTWTVGSEVETVNESPGDAQMIPAIASAYVNRGLIYSFRGNADAAIADFTKSIRLAPSDAWGYFYRALELETKGDLTGALADVSKAVELEPRNGNCLVEQGVILLLQGKAKEAQIVFDMLLESDRVLWQKRIDERTAAVKQKLQGRSH